MIYLDNNATTSMDSEVLDAMMPYLTTEFGNPGSLCSVGRTARLAIEHSREQVADFLHANYNQIIFTSGGSEANALAIIGNANYLSRCGRKKIITSAVEHESIIKASGMLHKQMGFDVDIIPVDRYGSIIENAAESLITEDVGIVSVMYVNNETGSINPVKTIADFCEEKHVLFHTDCVQAAGNYDIDVGLIGCDFASISAHKIHGPKGCGALFCSSPMTLTPVIPGGIAQEYGYRGGTENVAGIVGFGKACELAQRSLALSKSHISQLKSDFYKVLRHELSQHGLGNIIKINGDPNISRGKTLNLRFDGVDGETLLLLLDSRGVCVSAGSACRSLESRPSYVLTAMGIDYEDARNSIRISFSRMNKADDVIVAAKILAQCVKEILALNRPNTSI